MKALSYIGLLVALVAIVHLGGYQGVLQYHKLMIAVVVLALLATVAGFGLGPIRDAVIEIFIPWTKSKPADAARAGHVFRSMALSAVLAGLVLAVLFSVDGQRLALRPAVLLYGLVLGGLILTPLAQQMAAKGLRGVERPAPSRHVSASRSQPRREAGTRPGPGAAGRSGKPRTEETAGANEKRNRSRRRRRPSRRPPHGSASGPPQAN